MIPARQLCGLLGAFVLCTGGVDWAGAGTVTLTWDKVTTRTDGAPLRTLGGYWVYQGQATGQYAERVDVGNVTQYRWEGLPEGMRLYFVVTAYDTDGRESAPSNEVSGRAKADEVPPPAPVGPCADNPGAVVQTTLPVVPVVAKAVLYSDKAQSAKLKTVPPLLAGGCLVQMRLADRNSQAKVLVTLDLHTDATVYVGYDERPGVPRWLTDHYEATGVRLPISNAQARMMLWAIPVQAGHTLRIPGTRHQRAERGGLPYTVWVQRH